jgi:CDP-diacylglycerol--glycerol-3-phosphate 3-phosphatidyltransferase
MGSLVYRPVQRMMKKISECYVKREKRKDRKPWLKPNHLTLAGIIICAVASITAYFEYLNSWTLFVAGVLFTIGFLFDTLDGVYARLTGQESDFGAFFDSTSDRPGEMFAFAAVAVIFSRHHQYLFVLLTGWAAGGAFMVSYVRAKAEQAGYDGEVGFGSRPARCILLCVAIGLTPIFNYLLELVSLKAMVVVMLPITWITTIQRVLYVRRQIKAKKA